MSRIALATPALSTPTQMISGTPEPFRFGEGFENACEYWQGRHEYDGRADPKQSSVCERDIGDRFALWIGHQP